MVALGAIGTACGGGADVGADGAPDGAAVIDATPDAALPPMWDRTLPPAAATMGERRGLAPARGIIHLHTPYSHDACDGRPRANGKTGAVDEQCVADLRAGLCDTRIDFAVLTDHDATMADEPFADLFLARGDDELVTDEGGAPFAARMRCPDGRQVLLFVGGENDLMPLMLDRHPDGDVQTRHDVYNAETPEAVATFRALGGLAWIPHTESRPIELLRELGPDGLEIYNLHANVDPDIRVDSLGLDRSGAIEALAEFVGDDPAGPEPDLAILSFLLANGPSIERWNALLGDGRRVTGTAGSDAHQNVLPILLRDGERGDSYRRVMRWFSNVVLVHDPTDPAAVEAALAAGRSFAVFEIFGTPVGFDVVVETAGGSILEIGADDVAGAGDRLVVSVPSVAGLDPGLPAPAIAARVLRVDAGGVTEVAAGPGPTLEAPLDSPGAYRVEVTIVPHHLGPYLGNLGPDLAEVEQVWIYGNPIYVN